MNVVKIPQTDVVAVAPGCFDLPVAQGIDLCEQCADGKMPNGEDCAACDGAGYVRVRLVTSWRFTQEEWDYLASLPLEKRGVYLSVMTVQTPPVYVMVQNPFDIW